MLEKSDDVAAKWPDGEMDPDPRAVSASASRRVFDIALQTLDIAQARDATSWHCLSRRA